MKTVIDAIWEGSWNQDKNSLQFSTWSKVHSSVFDSVGKHIHNSVFASVKDIWWNIGLNSIRTPVADSVRNIGVSIRSEMRKH